MAELYWGDKRVLGIKPPGGEYVDLSMYNIIGLDVTVSSSKTSLGRYDFSECLGLTSITIPDSVTSLESNCFSSCTALKKVYFAGDPPTVQSNTFSGLTLTIYHKAANVNWTDTIKTTTYGGAVNVTWSTY